jgi:hypothetical protein
MKKRIIIIIILFLISFRAISNPLVLQQLYGTWKLVSITRENSSGKKLDEYGMDSIGYINYAPHGRMMVIIVKGNRKKPLRKTITPTEAINLLSSMTSYAGHYEIHGNQIIHHVDISWNEAWTGTTQKRFYKLEGPYLILTMPTFFDPKAGQTRIDLKWKKI